MKSTNRSSVRVPARLHPVLARQMASLGIEADETLPPWFEGLAAAVGAYYDELETARNRLEQAVRLTNDEIQVLEDSLADMRTAAVARSEEHYLDLFERSPIPTWEEDFGAVAAWLLDLRSSGVVDLVEHLESNPDLVAHGVTLIRVTNANHAAAELVGAPDEASLIGPIRADLLDELSVPSFIAQFAAVWESTERVTTPVVGKRINGDQFDGLIEWRAVRLGEGFDYSRVLVTIVDITEQKEAERRARDSLRSQDEMMASVTHELRTPLAAVMGFAEILRGMDQGDYEEEREGLLGIIAGQAADLSDLVEDLLTNARSELGQLEVASVSVNVFAQLAQVREARPDTDKPMLVPERPSEPVTVLGDPTRVRQILRNLITNANRYGGDEIRIEVDGDGELVTVRVMDNGDGLAPGSEEHVFERYGFDESSARHPGSVGLGLTIARDLAGRMGGTLEYARRDGWTSFELTLPATPQPSVKISDG